ncbi:MAG: DUF2855 family protein [Xanthobacteraceae bacterium]|nr:DUF2855 family protein [Xanthobacteraceae bacterium]
MSDPARSDFLVDRHDLKRTELAISARAALAQNAVLLKVDRFAFTANNVTYALVGDQLKYWHLFPARAGFGIVPVWGFGEVIESRHGQIKRGERLFGYFPMSTHLVIEPARVSERGLFDGAAHRQEVSPVYNAYARVSGDPQFAGKSGDYQALLRPLFMLSFLVDDFLGEASFFGATSVLLTSASSKTAIGLAYLLKKRGTVKVVGLTSGNNRAFVENLGCYDAVVTYDAIEQIPSEPVVIVDMAGNAGLLTGLHNHFAANVKYSCRVGLTHADAEQPPENLPGAKPVWFFAPDQMKKRAQDWGKGIIDRKIDEEWPGVIALFDGATRVEFVKGEDAVRRIYLATLEGKTRPDTGYMLSMWD